MNCDRLIEYDTVGRQFSQMRCCRTPISIDRHVVAASGVHADQNDSSTSSFPATTTFGECDDHGETDQRQYQTNPCCIHHEFVPRESVKRECIVDPVNRPSLTNGVKSVEWGFALRRHLVACFRSTGLSPFTLVVAFWVAVGVGSVGFGQDLIQVPDDVADLRDAIVQVSDGGIIEISTDLSVPSGGFDLSDLGKGFTLQAVEGTTVALNGGGTTRILTSINSSISSTGPLVFRNIVFENGYSNENYLSGGLTLDAVEATFIGCVFRDNVSENIVVGGAIYVGNESEVTFIDCQWLRNTSQTGGAGLGIRGNSRVFVHNSGFSFNLANPPGHNVNSGGGAINNGNSTLRVSNTRFEANEAGGFGGALYSIGNWIEPYTTARADVIISNCTFIDNRAERDASVSGGAPTEGGAVNAEDQTLMRIFNSRFVTNRAMIGGGINLYRSEVEIHGCTFQGNQATDTAVGSGFGGAISLTSQDGSAAGSNNYPPARVVLEDSFIQGRYGSVTTVAQAGGGLRASGDSARVDGDPDPPDLGTVAENRAVVVIRDTVFLDCDVYKPVEGAGNGGGISVGLTQLDIQDSLIINCDAMGEGPGATGGGITIMNRSLANMTGTFVAGNTALRYGAGIFVQGSEINASDCTIVENEVSPGVDELASESYGAGIFTGPDIGRGLEVSGVFENCIISNNVGMQVFDDDRNAGPVNDVRYNSNTFYSTHFGDDVYNDAITPRQDAAGLNELEVVRTDAPNTLKSQVDNVQAADIPIVGTLLAAPPKLLGTNAPGDPAPLTDGWLGFAWSGGVAVSLDGTSLTDHTGFSAASVGDHTLVVDSESFAVSVTAAPIPEGTLDVSPQYIQSGGVADLFWATPVGAFLDCEIDQGVSIAYGPSGSVQVSAVLDRTFHLVTITEEGGTSSSETLFVGTPPDEIFSDGFETGDFLRWSGVTP